MNENFEFSWEQIKTALGIKKQKELAEILRLSQSAITEGKKTGKFPEKWAEILEDRYGISSEWILRGKGVQKINDKKTKAKKYKILELLE
ncbi:MAG: hypothetical protein EOM23_08010, partial [Candidatus Moranbacteria bacterium]|nr:hypothetical protein [Candidatus Moranbacteria bacterium]